MTDEIVLRTRVTSTAVPRFSVWDARGPLWTLRGLWDPDTAKRFFRVALELNVAGEDDVRQWARAYVKAGWFVPGWVWDVLDPEVPVAKALEDTDMVEQLGRNFVAELAVLEAAVRGGTLTPEKALVRIHQRHRQGDYDGYDGVLRFMPSENAKALSALADGWEKERRHREASQGVPSPDFDALVTRLRALLERFKPREMKFR